MLPWIFAVAQVGALLCLLWRGWWRRYPLFLGFLACSSWQAVAGVFATLYSRAWWAGTWMPVERWHVWLAVLASLEVLWRQTAWLDVPERRGLRAGVTLVAGALGWLAWMVMDTGATPYAEFLRLREAVWVACSIAMVSLMVFGVVKSVPGAAHRWLLGLWMLAHAGIAPMLHVVDTQWFTERTVYRVVVILLCLGWTLLDSRHHRKAESPQRHSQLPA